MSVPTPPFPHERSEPRTRKPGERLVALAGILGGIAAILTAVGVLWTTLMPGVPRPANPVQASPTDSGVVVERQPPSPTATVEPTPSDVSVQSETPEATAPEVRNATRPGRIVTIVNGYSIDLDSREANWGITQYGSDFSVSSDRISWQRDAAEVAGSPSYQTCVETTGYANWWSRDNLNDGAQFCVRTTDKRYSWVKIVRVKAHLQAEITTWEPQGS